MGVKEAPLHDLYPSYVTHTLREAIKAFERRMPGFISPGTERFLMALPLFLSFFSLHQFILLNHIFFSILDAILHGVETRTSAPVCTDSYAHIENTIYKL